MAALMVVMGRRWGPYGCAIENGEKLETELIKIPRCNGKWCFPIWRLRTDNVLRVCINGSGGNGYDKCSDLSGGCSDGDSKVEYDGDGGNGIGDGSNGGNDDSSDSSCDGKFASVTKLHL